MKRQVNETLNLNRGYEVTWLGENTCADYVKQLNDERLLHLWHALDNSKYHKDFCRMTYLFNEGGGFSVEPETAPVVPFASMVEPDTTFAVLIIQGGIPVLHYHPAGAQY